jgi:hypothetical protein
MIDSDKGMKRQTSGTRWVWTALRLGIAYFVLVDMILLLRGDTSGIVYTLVTILFILISQVIYRHRYASVDAR